MKYRTEFEGQLQEEFDRRVQRISRWEETASVLVGKFREFYREQILLSFFAQNPNEERTDYNQTLCQGWRAFWSEIVSIDPFSLTFIETFQKFISNVILTNSYFKIVKVQFSLEDYKYVIVDNPPWGSRVHIQVRYAEPEEEKATQSSDTLIEGWKQQLRCVRQNCIIGWKLEEDGDY